VTTARDAILAAVRAARPAATPLPDVRAAAAAFVHPDGDVSHRFAEVARAGGAHVVEGARVDVARLVREAYPDAARIVSMLRDVAGTAPMPADPHTLADTELFVCEGVLGVAENGAIWLPQSRLGERAALWLATHVAVVLHRASIVPHMHAAYEAIDVSVEPFGAFVAGPSKTADIEQSLVVGAHGPKGLTVVLVSD